MFNTRQVNYGNCGDPDTKKKDFPHANITGEIVTLTSALGKISLITAMLADEGWSEQNARAESSWVTLAHLGTLIMANSLRLNVQNEMWAPSLRGSDLSFRNDEGIYFGAHWAIWWYHKHKWSQYSYLIYHGYCNILNNYELNLEFESFFFAFFLSCIATFFPLYFLLYFLLHAWKKYLSE